jgi:hypothetical protein
MQIIQSQLFENIFKNKNVAIAQKKNRNQCHVFEMIHVTPPLSV